MLEQSLRELFEQQAEVEPPPGRVTVAEVIRQGRLRRRRHRIGAVGAPVLAAIVVAAVALIGAPPSGILGRPTPQAGGYGRLAGGAFDPSYLGIKVGWLPAGAVVTDGEITPGGEALRAIAPRGGVWAVGVYARNVCDVRKTRRFECLPFVNTLTMLLGTTLSTGTHGPVIDGHGSRWLQGADGAILAWQYAPGAWAVVQSSSGAGTAVRIARAVEYGQHVAIRFASRFTSVPRGWRISGLRFAREHGVYLASTYAIARLPAIRPTTPVFAPALDEPYISISPAYSGSFRCGLDPSAPGRQVTIHGYRFTVQDRGIGDGGVLSVLCSNHVDGLRFSITESAAGGHMGFPPTDVMERLQLLGAKPADWVTNPLP
jgi:hypothetical protein